MRNIPGPWQGPFAVESSAGAVAARVPSVSPTSSVNQAQLIQRILSQLQPQISGAVQAAISSSRTPVARPQAAGVGVGGVFGGDNSVRIETPEFNIAY